MVSVNRSWLILFGAGLLEICWSIGLKYTNGFTRLTPIVFTLISLVLSMYLLGRAAQNLPLGTAYAVWVGIGSLGATLFGIYLFHESASPFRLFFLALLLVAIIGIKVTA